METAVPEGLTVLLVPETYRRRLRTTNCPERVIRELERRTRVATLFPNEASLLRLGSALAAEISEEWETNRVYLALEVHDGHLPAGGPRRCPESGDRPGDPSRGTPRKSHRHQSV